MIRDSVTAREQEIVRLDCQIGEHTAGLFTVAKANASTTCQRPQKTTGAHRSTGLPYYPRDNRTRHLERFVRDGAWLWKERTRKRQPKGLLLYRCSSLSDPIIAAVRSLQQ